MIGSSVSPALLTPHVVETLPALRDRGLKMGIVTDAHNGNALKRLKKAGIQRQ